MFPRLGAANHHVPPLSNSLRQSHQVVSQRSDALTVLLRRAAVDTRLEFDRRRHHVDRAPLKVRPLLLVLPPTCAAFEPRSPVLRTVVKVPDYLQARLGVVALLFCLRARPLPAWESPRWEQ